MAESKRINTSWSPKDAEIIAAQANKIGKEQPSAGLHSAFTEWKKYKGTKYIEDILADKKKKDERENQQKCE